MTVEPIHLRQTSPLLVMGIVIFAAIGISFFGDKLLVPLEFALHISSAAFLSAHIELSGSVGFHIGFMVAGTILVMACRHILRPL